MSLFPDQLSSLEALVDGATAGPWTAVTLPLRSMIVPVGVPAAVTIADVHQYASDLGPDHAQRAANAAFIATSREAVPALLAEVRRLREASEWQPIETAPRDGWFDAWRDGVRFPDTRREGSRFFATATGEYLQGVPKVERLNPPPTHWRPLPDPPHSALNPESQPTGDAP